LSPVNGTSSIEHTTALPSGPAGGGLIFAVRVTGLVLFGVWVWRYIGGDAPLLHGSLLIFHEAGHVFFMPFGEFMMVLGGSLFQLMVPAFFVAYFLHRRDHFAASFAGLYLAASLAGVALYIGDARAGALPLLGGDRTNHDWTFLLIELGMLERDTAIALIVHRLALAVFWVSLACGLVLAWRAWDVTPGTTAAGSDPAAAG
jgi:hypothetical protein